MKHCHVEPLGPQPTLADAVLPPLGLMSAAGVPVAAEPARCFDVQAITSKDGHALGLNILRFAEKETCEVSGFI